MRKTILGIVALCLFVTPLNAQIKVRKQDRVQNIDPGFCAFCVLDTLGRHHQIKPLIGLLGKRQKESVRRVFDQNRQMWIDYVWTKYPGGVYQLEPNHGGGDQALRNKLDSLGVKYRIQNYHDTDKSILKYAIKTNKLGCLIVVKDWEAPDPHRTDIYSPHAVLMTDYDSDYAYYIDPNDITEYKVTWEWFNTYWMGYVLVVEKE